MKQRSSHIWRIDKQSLESIVKTKTSIADILRDLGYVKHLTANLYKSLKLRMDEDNIDYSHIKSGISSNLNRNFERYTKEDALNKMKKRQLLHYADKKRIIKFDIIEHNKCLLCGIEREWNGKYLNLQLDHINGDPMDNDPSNLRYLCPNCHSQTETFCCGNKPQHTCIDCGIAINKLSTRCIKCSNIISNNKKKKFEISEEDLTKLVCSDKIPFTRLGEMYGVSDNTIRYRCIQFGIDIKTRKKYEN